jgi:hypothetical protein
VVQIATFSEGSNWDFGVVIHMYMEMSEGNSPCSCLYLNKKKGHFFFFLLFSSTKLENSRAEQVCQGQWGLVPIGRMEMAEKGDRRVNMVQILCTHVWKCKNDAC